MYDSGVIKIQPSSMLKSTRLSSTELLTLIKRRVESGEILTLSINASTRIIKNYPIDQEKEALKDFDAYLKNHQVPLANGLL
jgi:hypothetical protein